MEIKSENSAPESILAGRAAFSKRSGQFTLRTFLLGVTIAAVACFIARISSGAAVLDLIPLAGALAAVALVVAGLYYWLRIEGLLVGGLSAALSAFLLGTVPLWIQEGLDEKMGTGRVVWERVRPSEIGFVFLVWLLVLGIFAFGGMLIGGFASLWNKRRVRRVREHASARDGGALRYLQARQTANVRARVPASVIVLFVLLLVAWLCGSLIAQGSNSAIDSACWLGAPAFLALLLIVAGQLLRNRGVALGGIAFMFVFAFISALPIWRTLGRPPGPMIGYIRLPHGQFPPSFEEAVLWTFGGWLSIYLVYALIGGLVGLWAARRPRRQPLLPERPVTFPTSAGS